MYSTDSLLIQTEPVDGGVELIVSGELDLATRDRLQVSVDWALASGEDLVILDLSALSFIDASGLHTLVPARDSARIRGATLEIRDPSPALRRLLQLTGLEDLVDGVMARE